jgi:YbaB/EbfC DNA-binding family
VPDSASRGPRPGSSAWVAGVDAAAGALTQQAVDLQLELEERAERARRLAERTEEMVFEASDASGAVRVRVAASGVVVGLDLSERVHRWPAERLAGEILVVMRRAQASIASGMRPVLAETIGAESATGRAILAQYEVRFPPEPEAPSVPVAPPVTSILSPELSPDSSHGIP